MAENNMSATGAASVGGQQNIFQPKPWTMSIQDLKNSQGTKIPLNRPLYVFIPRMMDAGDQLKVSKRSKIDAHALSADEVKQLNLVPPGSYNPGTPGSWVRLQDKAGDKPGQKTTLNIIFHSMDPRGTSKTVVHVSIGDNIYFAL
jgi:hypothetical protein